MTVIAKVRGIRYTALVRPILSVWQRSGRPILEPTPIAIGHYIRRWEVIAIQRSN